MFAYYAEELFTNAKFASAQIHYFYKALGTWLQFSHVPQRFLVS